MNFESVISLRLPYGIAKGSKVFFIRNKSGRCYHPYRCRESFCSHIAHTKLTTALRKEESYLCFEQHLPKKLERNIAKIHALERKFDLRPTKVYRTNYAHLYALILDRKWYTCAPTLSLYLKILRDGQVSKSEVFKRLEKEKLFFQAMRVFSPQFLIGGTGIFGFSYAMDRLSAHSYNSKAKQRVQAFLRQKRANKKLPKRVVVKRQGSLV